MEVGPFFALSSNDTTLRPSSLGFSDGNKKCNQVAISIWICDGEPFGSGGGASGVGPAWVGGGWFGGGNEGDYPFQIKLSEV